MPELRFDFLKRIIFCDDFDTGLNGWTTVIGNYEDSLDSMLPEYRGWRPPMLSNLTVWDTGTAGSMDGCYAMKLATRPLEGNIAQAMKRLTWRRAARVRFECYFSFKPEPDRMRLADTDIRAVGFGFDLQEGESRPGAHRVHPLLRYLNSFHGERARRWQFKSSYEPFRQIGSSGETVSFCPYLSRDWNDLPGGEQLLCYNEIATKINWHYFRLDFDLASMSYLTMRCNDREWDLSGIEPIRIPAMPNLWCMLQPLVWVEADSARRVFLYLDSAALSAEEL